MDPIDPWSAKESKRSNIPEIVNDELIFNLSND